ncbi:MAG: DEAD/DEAH box helicase, partial [Planctomycetota bacterium]
AAPPGKLRSTGRLPWRLLAYMLEASPDVGLLRKLVSKRLMDGKRLTKAQQALEAMLITLWRAGYVTLEPEPPKSDEPGPPDAGTPPAESPEPKKKSTTQLLLEEALSAAGESPQPPEASQTPDGPPAYRAEFAHPTEKLRQLVTLRGLNPLYGVFLVNQLGIANREERVQAMESVLELPRSVGRYVRVPDHDELPPGPLATTRLDDQLLRLGLVTQDQLVAPPKTEEYHRRRIYDEERPWVLTLAEKLRLQFDYDFPGVHDVHTQPVWAAGEVLQFGGDFNKYVTGKHLQKQEGVIFRHLLRLILLAGELAQLCPPDVTEEAWRGDLQDIAGRLTATCREVDPSSTEKALEQAQDAADPLNL